MTPLRNLTPIRHPYLFGGVISGALIAGAVAAFISIGLISESTLSGGGLTVSPPLPGTLTIGALGS